MTTGRKHRIAMTILAVTSLLLWLALQTDGNVAPVCVPPGPCREGSQVAHGGWTEIVAVNPDSVIEAEKGSPLPLWRVRHTDGGIIALGDVSVHADCTLWITSVEVEGKQIRVRSETTQASPEGCSWHAGKRRWSEFRLKLPPAVYQTEWTRDGQVIDKREIAVPN